MYKFDSGLISIITAIAAILIGVYSFFDDKQKKKGKKNTTVRRPEETGADDELSFSKILNNPLEAFLSGGKYKNSIYTGTDTIDDKTGYGADIEENDDPFDFSVEGKTGISREKAVNKVGEEDVFGRFDLASAREILPVDELKYNNELADSIENSDVIRPDTIKGKQEMKTGDGSLAVSAGLRKRLKLNPGDLILFSEILKPKYKDF